MKTPKAPSESPEAKAKRLAEESRADAAMLASEQDVLDWKTRARNRRFGLMKSGNSGSQGNISGVAALANAASFGGAGGGNIDSFLNSPSRGFSLSNYLMEV